MQEASGSLRWALFFLLTMTAAAVLLIAPGAEGALDAVELWNEDFTDSAKVIRDGAVVGITATDGNSTGGTRNATVSDPANPGDSINVTLYDDGTHGDATANDGIYTGNVTVGNDGGTSGSATDEASGVIDIAEGDAVSVFVDLDGDGSHSQVTVRTDYTGPGMATPFEGGYVSGDLIITITIIVEGEAELDPGSVTYSIDSGPSVPFVMIGPNTWQAVIDTTLLSDGPHTVTTLSADEAGNVGEETFEIIVDNTVPDIVYGTATILPSGDVTVPVTVDDMHLDHSTVMWRWDEGEWNHPGTSGTPAGFDILIPYEEMTPGNHSIEITAKDLANNSMTYILKFNLPEQSYSNVDISPPSIDTDGVEPGDDVPVGTTVENGGEVPVDVIVELYVDGEYVDHVTVTVDGNSSEDVELTWPNVTDGQHDVHLNITMPNATTGEEVVDTIPVTSPEGGPVVISVPKVTIDKPVQVPASELKPGGIIELNPWIRNPGAVERQVIVYLVVDGETVDYFDADLDGGDSEYVRLVWKDYTPGEHDVSIEVYMPNEYDMEDPVDSVQLTTDEGGPIVVPEDGDGKWIEGPLEFLNPLYDHQPFSSVPDDWKPWFLPLLLIGIILGVTLVGLGRRKKKRDEAKVPDTELKAVKMPPVTGDGSPAPIRSPEVPVSLTAADPGGAEDDGAVIPVDAPGVVGQKVPEPGSKPGDGGEGPPLDAPGVVPTPVPLAPGQTAGPTTTKTSEGPSTGTTTAKGPDKPPASVPPVVPPIASTTGDDGKGAPCVDIIDKFKTTARGVSDADAKADDAKDDADDAQEEADKADLTADDAEERAKEAEKECEDAKREYEGEGVEDAEEAAKKAEDRVKGMEDRLEELRGDIPPVDGVSTEPKPGYTHGGVGFGDMVHVTHVWYRDSKAEIDLNREMKGRYKEYKELKKDLKEAEEEAEEARKKADGLAKEAEDTKRRMDEACEKARKAKEEAERLRGAANDAQENATAMAGAATAAADAAQEADEAAGPEREKVADCRDCLAKVKRAKARIEELKRKYESLRGGSQVEGPWNRYENMDPHGAWDQWWHSFKGFRDEAKRLIDMKSFTDADLPEEYDGLWDWGGPFSAAVGYGVEDYGKCPIPTDTIKAVGQIYNVFQAMFNPKYSMGAGILNSHLESAEADAAAEAFRSFPRLMGNALKSFEKLRRLRELDGEIFDALQEWKECLDRLPAAPETPEVDLDKLCYKQCLDKLKELEEAERKLRELIRRAESCKPSGLEGRYAEANKVKGQLNGMKRAMDRCRDGLENYRRAHRAHLGIDD